MIGKTILHYKILEKLGEGGMGIVYKALDTRLNRHVAIKMLPTRLLLSAEDLARFSQEAKAAAVLNHPHIATVYEINERYNKPFIVMEYVDGSTLDFYISRAPLKLKDAVSIALQIADGLCTAHKKEVIHRDIKSSNILLNPEKQVKILDFGLAKTSVSSRLTQLGKTVGTVAYMSPEQIRGEQVDHRTDLWSLGVLLYEMITGQLPFKGDYDQAVFYCIQTETPEPLTAVRTGVPLTLEWIVNKLLSKDPAQRYQNAKELMIDLKAVDLQSSGVTHVSNVTSYRQAKWLNRKIKVIPLKWVMVFLNIVAISVILYLLLPVAPATKLSNYRYTPFETDGVVRSGRWSPDAKSVAYLKWVNGGDQIRVRDLDNTRSTFLTAADNIWNLDWSPNGKDLYYISDFKLQTIGQAGGNPKIIFPYKIWSASISPDNKVFLLWTYSSSINNAMGDSSTVFISTGTGGVPKPYQPAPFKYPGGSLPVYMKFSPDGSKIGLAVSSPEKIEFWILPWPDGPNTRPYKVFENIAFEDVPQFDWLADSRRIVLTIDNGMWIGDTDEGSLIRITSSQQGEYLNSVSADGKRILFYVSGINYDIIKLPLDGSDPVPLRKTAVNEYSPTLSADGQLMAYITDRSGRDEIWLEEKTGTKYPIVSNSDFTEGDSGKLLVSVISPDGKRIACNRKGSKSMRELWVSSTAGGKPVQMFADSLVILNPCWAPDGSRIFATIKDGDSSYSVIGPIGDGEIIHLPESAETFGLPAWSPDGNWIALKQEGRLLLISPDGKRSLIIIPPVRPSAWNYCIAWSRDSKKIYTASSVEKISRLDVIDVNSGTSKKIAEYGYDVHFGHANSQSSTAAISRDGKGVIVSARYYSGSLYILDGALN